MSSLILSLHSLTKWANQLQSGFCLTYSCACCCICRCYGGAGASQDPAASFSLLEIAVTVVGLNRLVASMVPLTWQPYLLVHMNLGQYPMANISATTCAAQCVTHVKHVWWFQMYYTCNLYTCNTHVNTCNIHISHM